jgi:hypothetical protein
VTDRAHSGARLPWPSGQRCPEGGPAWLLRKKHQVRRLAIPLWTAVVLVLALVAGLNVTGVGPASADSAPNPNAVTSSAISGNGDRFVFWDCADTQQLCEASYNSAANRWSRHVVPGTGLLDTPPSVSVDVDATRSSDGNPYLYVFFGGGPRDTLHEAYWTGRWHTINLGMGPIAVGGPAAPSEWWYHSASSTHGEAVAWMDAAGNLMYALSENPTSAKAWHGPYERRVGKLGSPPSVTDSLGYTETAWWHSPSGNLYSASLTDNGGWKQYGPCDWGLGHINSDVSVTWQKGLPTGEGWPGPDPQGHRPALTAPGKLHGDCPAFNWYGPPGYYTICWAGENKSPAGLWCFAYIGEEDLPNPPIVLVAGPFRDGNMGALSSAPSIAVYPYTQVCPNQVRTARSCEISDVLAFWEGDTPKSDLWMGNISTGKGPFNVGIGPLSDR